MDVRIGPNFQNELDAAGLRGLPFSYGSDGVFEWGTEITAPQRAAVEAVFAAHDPARPDPVAEAAKLLRAGVTITSTATPALDGTYGTTQQDETNITGLQVSIAAGAFPGFCRDIAGNRKAMTAAEFTSLATALMGFIVAVDEAKAAALAGGAWVAPSATVAIA